MKTNLPLFALVTFFGLVMPISLIADDDQPSSGHDAFLNGLREMDQTDLVSGVEVMSASKPRSLSPVVSRFKGWFIDVTEKTKESKLDGVDIAEGISLASKSKETSYWQFVETKDGYLVVATGGKYKDWVIGRDDNAKTRAEGPKLTVTPTLRLTETVTNSCYWNLTFTDKGLVLKATSGKYKDWAFDFGGGDPSHEESGREVVINVLLAERVVAGSYFAVKSKP